MNLSKIIVCLAFLFLNFKKSYAQVGFNIGIGYGVGVHTKTDGLSYIIKRYNDTRPYLSKQMKEPKFFRGYNLSSEVYFSKGLANFEFVKRISDVTARVDSLNQGRDFRYKVNSFNFGLAYKLSKNKDNGIGKYLGFDFSMITVRCYTRKYDLDKDAPRYKSSNSIGFDLSFAFTPYWQYTGNRFTTKIYFQPMLIAPDFWEVNQTLNPNTWSKDDLMDLIGKTSSLGICVRYNLIRNKK